jgi:hypothetical protein
MHLALAIGGAYNEVIGNIRNLPDIQQEDISSLFVQRSFYSLLR